MPIQYTLTSYPCPICESTESAHLYTIKGFSIGRCAHCGLVFVNPRISNDQLFEIYANQYFRSEDNGYEDYELTAHLRIKTFEKWYAEIEPFLKPGKGSALDIGCAAGYFLQVLSEKGWETEGIELETGMISLLRNKGYTIYNTPLEFFGEQKKYTLITLFDVVEHLPNLHTNIEKLAAILDKDGCIAIVTPDFGSRQRRMLGKRWFQFKPKEHIQYFTEKTLGRAIERHGLHIVHTSACGQYADTSFLYNRLIRYGFSLLARLFKAITNALNLSEKSWYADTGSMLVILRKKG